MGLYWEQVVRCVGQIICMDIHNLYLGYIYIIYISLYIFIYKLIQLTSFYSNLKYLAGKYSQTQEMKLEF